MAVSWPWLAQQAAVVASQLLAIALLPPLPPFLPRAAVRLLPFSPSHMWACPCCWRRRVAVVSTLSAILRRYLALSDGTVSAVCALLARPCAGPSRCHGGLHLPDVALFLPLESPTRQVVAYLHSHVALIPMSRCHCPPSRHLVAPALRDGPACDRCFTAAAHVLP